MLDALAKRSPDLDMTGATVLRFPVVNRRGRAIPLRVALRRTTTQGNWVHLAYEGEWKGHSAGEFQFTLAIFEELKANLERQANDVPLTWEHPDEDPAEGRPAAGWLSELRIERRSDGLHHLMGFVKPNQKLLSRVRNDEYRYTSVVVSFQATDRKSGRPIGAYLHEVGVTNNPFVDGQERMAFSARRPSRMTTPAKPQAQTVALASWDDYTANAEEQLGISTSEEMSDADFDRMVEHMQLQRQAARLAGGDDDAAAEMAEDVAATDPALPAADDRPLPDGEGDSAGGGGGAPEEPAAGGSPVESELMSLTGTGSVDEAMAVLREVFGVTAEMPLSEIKARGKEVRKMLKDLRDEVKALRADKEATRLSAAKARIDAVVDEAHRAVYLNTAKSDPEAFEKLIKPLEDNAPAKPEAGDKPDQRRLTSPQGQATTAKDDDDPDQDLADISDAEAEPWMLSLSRKEQKQPDAMKRAKRMALNHKKLQERRSA